MSLSNQEKEYLDIIGKFYSAEKKFRGYSEYLLLLIFILSILNTTFDAFNLLHQNIIFSIAIIISIISVITIILENKSKNNKNRGDLGRRMFFYNDIIDASYIDNTFSDLQIRSKNKKSTRTNYDDFYHHQVSNKLAQKCLNLYESIYYEYSLRVHYKSKNQRKFLSYWMFLLIIILFGMAFGSQSFRIIVTNLITIAILSSFAMDTLFLIFEWDKKSSGLKRILDDLKNVDSIEQLLFYFNEYTIVVRNLPSIPDSYFNEIKSSIEGEYNKLADNIEQNISQNWNN